MAQLKTYDEIMPYLQKQTFGARKCWDISRYTRCG